MIDGGGAIATAPASGRHLKLSRMRSARLRPGTSSGGRGATVRLTLAVEPVPTLPVDADQLPPTSETVATDGV